MSREVSCKYCGLMIHFENGKPCNTNDTYHDCPNGPWRQNAPVWSEILKELRVQTGQLTRIANALERSRG